MTDAAIPAPMTRTRNYFLRHWRGECSLAVSFWLNGVPAAIAIMMLTLFVTAVMNDEIQPGLYLAGVLAMWSVVTVVFLWQFVGIWHSGTRAVRRGGGFWTAAAFSVSAICLFKIADLLQGQAVPIILDAVAYVEGDPRLGVHDVRILRGGAEIEVTGPFSGDVVQQLTAALGRAPEAHVVHLDSIGGRVGVALRIAEVIAAHHLDT